MAEIKWIKMTVNMFDDEKIKLIESMPEGDTIIVIWQKLICLAGKINANGFIYLTENIPYSEEMLSCSLNRKLPIIRLAMKTFLRLGMVEINNKGIILVVNFCKHQNILGLEKIRNDTKLRVKNYREKNKLLLKQNENSNVTQNVTQCNDIEYKKKKNKEKEEEKNLREFKKIPPEISEVKEYFTLKNINSNEYEKFFNFYESKDWYVGKNKMKNWKAAASGWISRLPIAINQKEESIVV